MKTALLIVLALLLVHCKGPEPRKPESVQSGSYYKESIERSKKLLARDEQAIREIIERDSVHEYLTSPNGFWYYYEKVNDTARYLPREGDQILFSHTLMTLGGDTIYTAAELGPTSHVVDKQQLFPGLQNAVKLLKIHEKATFLFPSIQAYGYQGDNKAIAPLTPLRASVELHTIIIHKDSLN